MVCFVVFKPAHFVGFQKYRMQKKLLDVNNIKFADIVKFMDWKVRSSISERRKKFLYFRKKSKPALGPNQPPVLLSSRFISLVVKRPECDWPKTSV